jgi:hypothetical protein
VLSCHPSKQSYVRSILDQYRANLFAERQIDFELILHYAYELIVQQPSICVLLSSLFSWVLVDEYQDTKEIQYAILANDPKCVAQTCRATSRARRDNTVCEPSNAEMVWFLMIVRQRRRRR